MHYYKKNLGDYAKKAGHLSALEHGIYMLITDAYYANEKAPTLIEATRWARARTDSEKEAVLGVLDEFFKIQEDGTYHNKRIDEEIEIYRKKAARNREVGQLGGRPPKNQNETDSDGNENPEITQTVSKNNPNHKPLTINHKQEIKALVLGDAEDQPPRPAKPDCPHQEIIALYHEVLPQCPAIRDWTPARATQLRARWNESADRQNLEYWRGMFEYIACCDFLVGRSSKPFFADLEWITKSQNFTKIREGKYENR